MKLTSRIYSWVGILLFLIGEGMGLTLSGAVLWGEVEVRIRSSFTASEVMKIECPLMLSTAETGSIRAEIVNYTEKEIKPAVTTEISHAGGDRRASQTFQLGQRDSTIAAWTVTSDDAIFGRLILVSVFQSQYRDNPSRLGSCGIFLFDLAGLSGFQAFITMFAISLACLLSGAGIWYFSNKPVDDVKTNIARAGILLAVMNIASMLCAFPRWWGFILMLDAFNLLAISVILVEFVLFPQKRS